MPEILVVEDTLTQAMRLQHSLEAGGFKVKIAKSAESALDELEKSQPQAILSDINMPDIDGFQFAKTVKDSERLRNIPLVLLSAVNNSEEILKIIESQADSFFYKSYAKSYLDSRLTNLLAARDKRSGVSQAEHKPDQQLVPVEGPQGTMLVRPQQLFDLLLSAFELAVSLNNQRE